MSQDGHTKFGKRGGPAGQCAHWLTMPLTNGSTRYGSFFEDVVSLDNAKMFCEISARSLKQNHTPSHIRGTRNFGKVVVKNI